MNSKYESKRSFKERMSQDNSVQNSLHGSSKSQSKRKKAIETEISSLKQLSKTRSQTKGNERQLRQRTKSSKVSHSESTKETLVKLSSSKKLKSSSKAKSRQKLATTPNKKKGIQNSKTNVIPNITREKENLLTTQQQKLILKQQKLMSKVINNEVETASKNLKKEKESNNINNTNKSKNTAHLIGVKRASKRLMSNYSSKKPQESNQITASTTREPSKRKSSLTKVNEERSKRQKVSDVEFNTDNKQSKDQKIKQTRLKTSDIVNLLIEENDSNDEETLSTSPKNKKTTIYSDALKSWNIQSSVNDIYDHSNYGPEQTGAVIEVSKKKLKKRIRNKHKVASRKKQFMLPKTLSKNKKIIPQIDSPVPPTPKIKSPTSSELYQWQSSPILPSPRSDNYSNLPSPKNFSSLSQSKIMNSSLSTSSHFLSVKTPITSKMISKVSGSVSTPIHNYGPIKNQIENCFGFVDDDDNTFINDNNYTNISPVPKASSTLFDISRGSESYFEKPKPTRFEYILKPRENRVTQLKKSRSFVPHSTRPTNSCNTTILFDDPHCDNKKVQSSIVDAFKRSKPSSFQIREESSTTEFNKHELTKSYKKTKTSPPIPSGKVISKKEREEFDTWTKLQKSHFSEIEDFDLSFS